jgi:hypothetical protein
LQARKRDCKPSVIASLSRDRVILVIASLSCLLRICCGPVPFRCLIASLSCLLRGLQACLVCCGPVPFPGNAQVKPYHQRSCPVIERMVGDLKICHKAQATIDAYLQRATRLFRGLRRTEKFF